MANEWLDTKLGNDIWNKKYRLKEESLNQWLKRVSGGDKDVMRLIKDKKALFGGRTMSNRGTNKNASYSNCYSLGYIGDSLDEIMEANTKIAKTFKAQGGQGISLSQIRPKGSPIQGGLFYSDGILPFMKLFNQTTDSISQGGSRKGALIITLDAKHKEAETFIHAKSNDNQITKANISLGLDDDFMLVAREGRPLHVESKWGNYDVDPRKLLMDAAENAWGWGEPGAIYTNRFRNYNIMEKVQDYQIVTCNPCGEQPLPANGACNLGAINMSAFVRDPFTEQAAFDTTGFLEAVRIMVRALDKVLDENLQNHPLPEQREMAEKYRNIGLGVMGYGDTLIKLNLVYGSDRAIRFTDKIGMLMFREVVAESSKMAKEMGSFPAYDPAVFDSKIMKLHFTAEELHDLKQDGLRNCSLLSIAPTGSIATMLNVSSGAEPNFAFSYWRKTESLNGDVPKEYQVFTGVAEEYYRSHEGELPETFVSAGEIPWKQRVDTQAVWQKHIDTGISSTVNLPENATKEEIFDLLIYAWEKGCKGITVFRDNCMRTGILTHENKEEKPDPVDDGKPKRGEILPPNDNCIGLKRTITTGCGTLHVEAFFDPETGEMYETYFSKGSTGGCNSYMTGLSRMVSLAARGGVSFDDIIDQLQSTLPCPSYVRRHATQNDTSKGTCCPSAIAYALVDMKEQMQKLIRKTPDLSGEEKELYEPTDACPDCGNQHLSYTNGCVSCPECGWSKCN